jgi:hypothetical protein
MRYEVEMFTEKYLAKLKRFNDFRLCFDDKDDNLEFIRFKKKMKRTKIVFVITYKKIDSDYKEVSKSKLKVVWHDRYSNNSYVWINNKFCTYDEAIDWLEKKFFSIVDVLYNRKDVLRDIAIDELTNEFEMADSTSLLGLVSKHIITIPKEKLYEFKSERC